MGGIWRKAEARWRNVTHQKESSIASCDVRPCDAGVHCRRVQPVAVHAIHLHRAPACPNAFDDRETPAKQKRDEKRCSDIFARQQQQMHSKFKNVKTFSCSFKSWFCFDKMSFFIFRLSMLSLLLC